MTDLVCGACGQTASAALLPAGTTEQPCDARHSTPTKNCPVHGAEPVTSCGTCWQTVKCIGTMRAER